MMNNRDTMELNKGDKNVKGAEQATSDDSGESPFRSQQMPAVLKSEVVDDTWIRLTVVDSEGDEHCIARRVRPVISDEMLDRMLEVNTAHDDSTAAI
jgi:hypothetical protein